MYIENANIRLHSENILNGLDLAVGHNAGLNLKNGIINNAEFGSLKLNGDMNLAVDVDLANQSMDRIMADSYLLESDQIYARSSDLNGYKINVSEMNLLSDSNETKTSILFADEVLKNNVITSVSEVAYSPVYKYDVSYDRTNGSFLFTRKEKNDFNPAVLDAPVAAQVGGYLNQLRSYEEAFADMDAYMTNTQKERENLSKNVVVCYQCGQKVYYSLNNICNDQKVWVRPYATFEKVSLKNGPKVSNTAYGSYIGGESQIYNLGQGWDAMAGLYLGYNNSRQKFDGIRVSQNGGTLGLVGMVYKNNFFAGLTLNAGASRAEADTRYGDESFSILTSGVAGKTGYNIELKNGQYILQPNVSISYSYINTLGYTNAAGVKIKSDQLNAIQFEPGIKLIANLNNGLQPYASISVVETLMDKTKFEANHIALPELSVKPFVKYGFGVRQKWNRHLDGYAQTHFMSGGRTGADIRLGIRWMF